MVRHRGHGCAVAAVVEKPVQPQRSKHRDDAARGERARGTIMSNTDAAAERPLELALLRAPISYTRPP